MTAVPVRSSPTTAAGWPVRGASTTRRCAQFVLRRLAIDKATVSAVARELGRSWDTVNAIAVAATGELLLAAGPARLDGVRVIGVDEHKWSHVLGADTDGFVTVITDLTDVVAGHGPARLLDMVTGPSAAALTGWLAQRSPEFRAAVEVVAMDGFSGYKNAAVEAMPEAVTVMDPFHVVALAGHKARPVPPARPAGHPRPPRPQRRPAPRRAPRATHPRRAAHHTPVNPHRRGVRRRRPRRGRGDLVCLPAAHRRLRRRRPAAWQDPCCPP